MTNDTPPSHILFATDFTARCDRAQDRAVQLAVAWGARLTVVHALEPGGAADNAGHGEIPTLIAREAERLREELSTVEGLAANVIVRRGTPQDLVHDILSQDPAGLIVTGISRNDSLGRAILGSTTATLIRTGGVPVLVVKRRPIDAGDRVVFASDLSENSASAIRTGLGWLRPPAPVLFHVIDPPFRSWAEDKAGYVNQLRTESAAQCRRFLDEAVGTGAAKQFSVIVETGEPPAALAVHVIDADVDMVVVGTEARTGVLGVLVGSVASGILDEVPCDLLVLPAITFA